MIAALFSLVVVAAAPDFVRDVQPILAEHCYGCHGPAERKGGLRLSNAHDAYLGGDSGEAPIAPGEPDSSVMIRRMLSTDELERMPPSGPRVPEEQVAVLRAWIAAGADWPGTEPAGAAAVPDHWSFRPPEAGVLPAVSRTDWVRNAIDVFVLARLEQEGLQPAPEAGRYTLIRRLSLDLLGLPPTPDEVAAFVEDPRPDSYERLVERLLASPHYGERRALFWLDAARYADTNGYEKDRARSIWPYRDWVIRAYNHNLPFDRFIIEQIAGDMLPNPSQEQLVATGFLRNSMVNEEGGVDVEEFRYEAMVDRVNTVSTVLLGQTMACAQCHTHKFEPITQREYFQFYAFLNNTNDVMMAVKDPETERRRTEIEAEIRALESALEAHFPGDADSGETAEAHLSRKLDAWVAAQEQEAREWTVLNPVDYVSKYHASFIKKEDGSLLVSGDIPNTDTYDLGFYTDLAHITAVRLEVLPDPSLPGGGPGRGVIMSPEEGDFLLSEIAASIAPWDLPEQAMPIPLQHATASHEAEGREVALALDGKLDTGWSIKGGEGQAHRAVFQFAEPVSAPGGAMFRLRLDQYFVHQHTIGRLRVSVTGAPLPVTASAAPAEVEAVLAMSVAERTETQRALLKAHFLRVAPELAEAHETLAALRASLPAYPTTLVLEERPDPRITRIHHRGEFLSPREAVDPRIPDILPPLPAHAPPNRLGFAHWLVSKENPLTARVTMNLLWQSFFGRGIVPTVDDFGLRGDPPSHQDLLDWLSVEFMRRDWNYRDMVRLIVHSAAYRQSSRVSEELLERDPENELLARGPRFRVDAEVVRDLALASSGLLDRSVGGPSVYPPMPKSLLNLTFGDGGAWEESTGGDRYRRGLYTYIKRTMPYPATAVFDGPARDVSCVRRVRSNTPLQALTLLNDDTFMEAARAAAARVCAEAGPSTEARIQHAFVLVLSRPPDAQEYGWVQGFLTRQMERLGPEQESEAWALVCRALLNLDETITKG